MGAVIGDFKLETIRWIDGVDHHGAMWTESGATVALGRTRWDPTKPLGKS